MPFSACTGAGVAPRGRARPPPPTTAKAAPAGRLPPTRSDAAGAHACGALQHGAEAFLPETAAHQRERAARQPVKAALGIEQPGAAGVRPRELDGRLDRKSVV